MNWKSSLYESALRILKKYDEEGLIGPQKPNKWKNVAKIRTLDCVRCVKKIPKNNDT